MLLHCYCSQAGRLDNIGQAHNVERASPVYAHKFQPVCCAKVEYLANTLSWAGLHKIY